jgi:hypothetical protein
MTKTNLRTIQEAPAGTERGRLEINKVDHGREKGRSNQISGKKTRQKYLSHSIRGGDHSTGILFLPVI